MSRRSPLIGTAAALAVAVVAATPTTALAASARCVVAVTLPAKVVLATPSQAVPVDVDSSSKGCARSASYRILVDGIPVGLVDVADGDDVTLPVAAGAGTYTAEYVRGTDERGDAVIGRDARSPLVAKLAAQADITSISRDGRKVTISAHVGQYVVDFDEYDDVEGTRVALQAETASGWQTQKTLTTNGLGDVVATVTTRSTAPTRWRAVAAETDDHWSRTSAIVRR